MSRGKLIRKVIFWIFLFALISIAIAIVHPSAQSISHPVEKINLSALPVRQAGDRQDKNKPVAETKDRDKRIQLDLDELRRPSSVSPLLKRSPFFRLKITLSQVAPGEMEKKDAILIPAAEIKKVEPFSYKGKGKIKGRAVIFIEDNLTGRVYFVDKGDMVGDYKVLDITEEEVVLCKESQEIRLTTKPKERPLKESSEKR